MGKILKVDINLNNNPPTAEETKKFFIIILVFACHFQHNKIISLQTATRGQIWPQPWFFFYNLFDVSCNDTNLRDFVTTGVL